MLLQTNWGCSRLQVEIKYFAEHGGRDGRTEPEKSHTKKWERHETKEQIRGLSNSREIPVKIEVHEFYGMVSELERKIKDFKGK